MIHHKDRHAPRLEFGELAGQILGSFGIEIGARLIKDKGPRPLREDGGQPDLLLLPLGQFVDGGGQDRPEPEGPRRLIDFGGDGFGRNALPFMGERQLVLDIQGEKLLFGVLKERSDLPRNGVDGPGVRRLAADQDTAFQCPLKIVGAQAVGEAHQRGLAAAAGPGAQHQFAGPHRKRNIRNRRARLERVRVGHTFKADHQRIPPSSGAHPTACWHSTAAAATRQAATKSHVSDAFQTSFR